MEFMPSCRNKVRKPLIALALVLVAVLSYLYSIHGEKEARSEIGFMTAIAKEDAKNYQIFLRLETVPGESTDEKHRGEIEVDSFAWGEQRSASASRPIMDGFRITMPLSKASTKLFLYGAGGTRVPKAVLSAKKVGDNQDFLKWTLTDVYIGSFKTVGNTHGDGIQDEIFFGFSKAEVEYRQKLPDGTYSAPVKEGWDQRTNRSA